jgi:putative ABC transport system permease protein
MSMQWIHPSWRFAWRTLSARPARTLLLAMAIALAAALVTAISSGLQTAQANLQARLVRLLGAVDARLVQQTGAEFDAAMLEQVRGWPGVQAVQGRLRGSITLMRADGATDDQGRVRRATAQARGADPIPDPRFDGLPLRSGRRPSAPGEVVLDPLSATKLAAREGDRLRVVRLGEPLEVVVSGVLDRPMLGALQQALVEMDRATLARAVGKPDAITAVAIALEPGTDVAAWCRANARLVPEEMLLEPAEMATSGMDRQVEAGRLGFILGCAIAVLAGAFIVGVGMTTSVSELERELATLRCLGASRRQLFAGPVLAGAALSIASAVAGVPIGLLGAWGVSWWFRSSLPLGLVPSGEGMSLALVGSLVAGVGGSMLPAWRAASTSPLHALRRRATPPGRIGPWACLVVGVGLASIEAGIMTLESDPQRKFWMHALAGLPLAHAGWFLICVPLLQAVSWCLAPIASRLLRLPPGLLRGSVARAPYRLGLTAGALMMGVSVLVTTWSHGMGMLGEIRDRVRFGDAFAMKVSGLSPADQRALRDLPGVRHAAAVGYLPLRVGGTAALGVQSVAPPGVICVGFEPDAFLGMNRLEWIQGTPEAALPKLRDGTGALVAEQFLTARGVSVGDTIELKAPKASATFEIVGVVSSAGLDVATQMFGIRSVYMEHAMSCVFLNLETVGRRFGTRDAVLMQMDIDPDGGPSDEALAEAVTEAAPGAIFASGRAIRAAIDDVSRLLMGVSGAVAFAALLTASLGVGSVIAAQVQGRRGELGVLRAIGAGRGALLGLVLSEAVLIAITAVLAGTGLGWELAWAGRVLFADVAGLTLEPIFPLGALAVASVVVLLLALAAAWPGARRLLMLEPRALLSPAS